jgi:hypothetical protein
MRVLHDIVGTTLLFKEGKLPLGNTIIEGLLPLVYSYCWKH